LRVRSLNDPRRGSLPTVQTVRRKPTHPSPSAARFQPCKPSGAQRRSRPRPRLAANRATRQAQTDAPVTIRLLIPTPAQRVSQICTETDVLAADVRKGRSPHAPPRLPPIVQAGGGVELDPRSTQTVSASREG